MQVPQEILELIKRINSAGGQGFLVGGCVRDSILGKTPKDFDIVAVGLNEASLELAFPEGSWVGKSFPVLIVGHVEIALARREKKVGKGHDGFVCDVEDVTLYEDLRRRDLTINAIAFDPINNIYLDPFHGTHHIKNKELHTVSSAFKEDPLRVFRAARFSAQLGFDFSLELDREIREISGELNTLSAERVWQELEKSLLSDNPSLFFYNLLDLGGLSFWFPEIENLVAVPAGPVEHHPEGSAFRHTMLVVDQAKKLGGGSEEVFAALTHDLGKALTDPSLLPKHVGHEEGGLDPLDVLCTRLKVPTRHRKLAELVVENHLRVHRFAELGANKKHDLVKKFGRFRQSVGLVCEADVRGRTLDVADYPSRRDLDRVFETCAAVKADPTWGEGPIVGERLRQARISAIKRAKI